MKTTGDQHLVKKINTSIVLERIKDEGPLSRADISERTGLNKGTVSSLVQNLIDGGLVLEIGPGQSSGGRKPVMVLFNHQAGYAVGVDLGVRDLTTALTDLHGGIVFEETVPLDRPDVAYVVDRLETSVRRAMRAAPPSRYGIVGVGVAAPGIVNADGSVLYAPNLDWRGVPLQAELAGRLGTAVIVDNEANMGAVGERHFGSGQGKSDLIYVSVGSGIGVGIVLNGQLYRGMTGFSGETGHTTIETDGRLCRCGNTGCWEMYASESALLTEARALPSVAAADGEPTMELLLALADGGDEGAIALFARTARYLAVGISNLIHTVNPGLVIIGNRFAGAGRWLEDTVNRELRRRTLPFHQEGLKLVFSGLGGRSAVLGAAHSAASGFFSRTKVVTD